MNLGTIDLCICMCHLLICFDFNSIYDVFSYRIIFHFLFYLFIIAYFCDVCVCVCALVQARPHVRGSEDNIQEWILCASQTLNLCCQACEASTFFEPFSQPNIFRISTVKLDN